MISPGLKRCAPQSAMCDAGGHLRALWLREDVRCLLARSSDPSSAPDPAAQRSRTCASVRLRAVSRLRLVRVLSVPLQNNLAPPCSALPSDPRGDPHGACPPHRATLSECAHLYLDVSSTPTVLLSHTPAASFVPHFHYTRCSSLAGRRESERDRRPQPRVHGAAGAHHVRFDHRRQRPGRVAARANQCAQSLSRPLKPAAPASAPDNGPVAPPRSYPSP